MDQVEEIRSKIDIVQLISEYVPLKKAGRNFKALCPFHSEKTSSFMVSPERQIWKCFGCGKGGTVYNFLMELERMDFGEALRFLAKRAGVTLISYRPTGQEQEKEKIYALNHLSAEFYHYLLLSHPIGKKALAYVMGRGINRQSLTLFKIGYAPSFGQGLQKYLIGKKGYQLEELTRAGLVTTSAGYFNDFFRDRLVFPLKDHRGNYVGFSGRVLGVWDEKNFRGPKYINTPETPVYQKGSLLYGLEITKEAIKKQNKAVIVEGEFDLISSYQAGVENMVAIKGSALTEVQVKLLKRFCENIAMALDMDLAGDNAARRGILLADSFGLNIRVVRIPEEKDPDELARKDPALLKNAIAQAIPIYDFFIESAFRRSDSSTPEGKRKIGEELLPILSQINDEILKSHYVRTLAEKLGVDEEAVLTQMVRIQAQQIKATPGVEKTAVEKQKSRREVLEEYLLALAFQGGEEEILLKPETEKLVRSPVLLRIIKIIKDYLRKTRKAKGVSQSVGKTLPPELAEIFNNFYLFDFDTNIDDPSWRQKEIEKTLLDLKKITTQEKLKELASKIAVFEKEGKSEEVELLKNQFRSVSRQLVEN